MSRVIQLKRGLKQNLPASAQQGEPLVTLDTGELFIGQGDGLPLLPVSGGVGGGTTDPLLASRVSVLENRNNLITRTFDENFTNNINVDLSKTTAAVNRNSVKIAKTAFFTEEFNNTDNTDLLQSSNVVVQNGQVTIAPNSLSGRFISKEMITQGTENLVLNSLINHYDPLGFPTHSTHSTFMVIS